MGIINIVKNIKELYPKHVTIVKVGSFYYCYGRDCYIMAYLLRYKINILKDNIYSCAFPSNAINKVMATLENKKINYIQIYERKNKSYISRSLLVRESLLDNLYELKDKYGVSICLLINVAIRNTLMEEKVQ